MILVCGSLADPVMSHFYDRLLEFQVPFRFVDQRNYPDGYQVDCHWKDSSFAGWLESAHWRVDFEELTGVYVRHFPSKQRINPVADQGQAAALHGEHDYGLESIFAALKCPIVNRFASCFSNQSKPFQAWQLAQLDLCVPSTLVTGSLPEARSFYEQWNGQVIYKSAGAGFIGTRLLTEEALAGLFCKSGAPVQLQELIPGTDIRVHVVGDQLFATRILSDAVDYRFPRPGSTPLRMEQAALSKTICSTCIRVSKVFGLLFAGIDLRETPGGQFYFFEANPAPAFPFYECRSGQLISKALADLLRGRRFL